MREALEKLNLIKGMLLLDTSGSLYILRDYTIVKDKLVETGFFIKKTSSITYIDSITTSRGKEECTVDYPANSSQLKYDVNDLVDDRNRYLRLQRDLNAMGYAIRKK